MAPSAAAKSSRADILYSLLSNPIYTGQIAHKGQLYPGQHPQLIEEETWTAVRNQLAVNTSHHRRKTKAAEPSLLAGLLVDARGERLTPSHAVKKGRRYRYYISTALITDAETDGAQGLRLAAREIEDAVIRILADALTNPARLVERLGAAGMASDQLRKLLVRATRMAAALSGSPAQGAKLVRELVEKIIVDEKTIIIKLRRGPLLGGDFASPASEAASDSAVELTAAVAFKHRGLETRLVLPGLAQQDHGSRCDPALIKAIARGRAWFEEIVSGPSIKGGRPPRLPCHPAKNPVCTAP
jgi:site-specific DNA recombinase